MSKSSDKLDLAIRIVNEENEKEIFADEYIFVKKYFNRKRLFLLSERHLFYLSRKEGNMKKFNVHKLDSITFDNKQIVLNFRYPKEIKIVVSKETEESQIKFIKELILVIRHLLSDSEIQKINFNLDTYNSEFSSILVPISLPTFYGSFCRFELSLEEFFFQPHELDEIKIRFLLIFHRKLVDFSSFMDINKASKFLFEFLPLSPSSKYVSIKQFDDNNIYHLLSIYASSLSKIENISIDGTANDQKDNLSFSNFLKSNLNSKMVGLSFFNSQFTNDHLNSLKGFIVTKKIQAIEFHNSFLNKSVFDFFISDFLPSISPCNEFTSLFLSDMEAIDFDEFYKNLPPQVKSLSIVNCDSSVNHVFRTIKTNSKSLKVINLSYNPISAYQNFLRNDLVFYIPDFINVLVLDYVTFPYGSLIPFLRSLFTEIMDGSEISIVHMIASDSDFIKLDEMFQQLVDDFQNKKIELKLIGSLKWDFNPISSHFISFLNLQSNLTELSISGCYSPTDKDGFDDFCSFISKNTSLEKLICRKFDQICLQSLTPQLINAVSSSKISYLDISSSAGGSACYQSLKEFIQKDDQNPQKNQSDIKCLIYDGLEPSGKEDLIDFIKFVLEHNCMTKCSFPIHDIEFLYMSRKINFYDIAQIVSSCQLETKNDYIKPFKVFYKENQFGFPFYFKDECKSIRSNNDENPDDNDEGHSYEEKNAEFFFGSFFEEINRQSYSKHDRCIFSLYTDDENLCRSKNSKSVCKTPKYPNKKVKNTPQKMVSEYDKDFVLPTSQIANEETPKQRINEKSPSKSPTNEETPKQRINEKSPVVKKSPVLIQSDSNDDNDDDYSYEYSSQNEKKITQKKDEVDFRPKSPVVNRMKPNNHVISPMKPKSPVISPMKPNLMSNRGRSTISPKKTIAQPKKMVASPVIELSDSDYSSYSYGYSKSDEK